MHRGPPSTPGSDPPHNPPALYDQSILFYIVSRETNRLSAWLDSFGATLSSTLQSVEAPRLPEILSRPTIAGRGRWPFFRDSQRALESRSASPCRDSMLRPGRYFIPPPRRLVRHGSNNAASWPILSPRMPEESVDSSSTSYKRMSCSRRDRMRLRRIERILGRVSERQT